MKFLRADIPYLRELALNNNPLQKIEGHAFEMVSPKSDHHHHHNCHHHHHSSSSSRSSYSLWKSPWWSWQYVQVPQIVSLDVSGCQIKKIAARAFQQVIIVIIIVVIFFTSSITIVIKVIIESLLYCQWSDYWCLPDWRTRETIPP